MERKRRFFDPAWRCAPDAKTPTEVGAFDDLNTRVKSFETRLSLGQVLRRNSTAYGPCHTRGTACRVVNRCLVGCNVCTYCIHLGRHQSSRGARSSHVHRSDGQCPMSVLHVAFGDATGGSEIDPTGNGIGRDGRRQGASVGSVNALDPIRSYENGATGLDF